MLELYAKIFFKLAEMSAENLSDLSMLWLTAVYNHEISERFSNNSSEKEIIRSSLINKAEDLIKRQAGNGDVSSRKALSYWNIEKKLMADIHAIVGDNNGKNRLVCTPRFAKKFGISQQVLQLIRDNRTFFSDTEHYLSAGGYYSSAGSSLFHLENGEYKKALTSLPESNGGSEAEFVEFCIERVKFEHGLYCVEKGEAISSRHFKSAPTLFDKVPRYEKELIDKAVDCYEADILLRFEEVISYIHSKRSTKEIRETLSLVMSKRGISLFNTDRMNLKNLKITIKKALKLDPENEFARGALNDAQDDLDVMELVNAMDKHKMNKACQLAAESKNPRVRDEFFEFMEDIIENMEEMEIDHRKETIMLRDISEWCSRVDPSHPIVDEIDDMLRMLDRR